MEKEKVGFRFENFEIDLKNRQLKSGNHIVPLNSKYFDVLSLLVKRHHQLISKQTIFEQVWQDTIVTDSALSQCIKDIRKSLGDDAHHPKYIKTVTKHGYMFIADSFPIFDEGKQSPKSASSLLRPYKFLDYYNEADQNLFFGREHEVETVLSKIISRRSFIIHGRSGVGKSSLIRAGLIPALKNIGHQTFVIRSFLDPVEQMAEALSSLVPKDEKNIYSEKIQDQIQRATTLFPERLFIFFFDQFEDFFLQLNTAQKEIFRQQLQAIFAKEESSTRFVFVLREDLLAEMSFFKPVVPEIFHHEFRLLKLSSKQAINAILKPAQAVGCSFEKKLASEILKDLGNGKQDIDPPQLQIVCDVLYDARDLKKGITMEQYEKLGRASHILESYMERVLNRFEDEDAFLAKQILKSLISVDYQRLILPLNELTERLISSKNSAGHIQRLLNELSDARLIRLGRQESINWVELSHDFLVPKIKEWVSDEEQKLKRAQSMLKNAMKNYEHHNLLLDEDCINVLLPFGPQLELSTAESYFIAKSMIFRRYVLPNWLKTMVPNLASIIKEAIKDPDPDIRICAVESCSDITEPVVKSLLNKTALWDKNLNVRKTASIVFLKSFGMEGQMLLTQGKNHKRAGLIRRAISLSFVRDYEITLVYLRKLPIFIAFLVVSGLIWVRIYRNRKQIFREISGATLGSTASGLLFGSFLGIALAFARHAPTFETITYLLSLISLAGFATFFGGLGISSGIVLMRHITYRHSQWWTVVGGTLGGFLIGALINVIGMDILKTLFGHQLIKITGAFEAAVIGFCLSLAIVIADQYFPKHTIIKIIIAAFGATVGAITLSLFKGNLFSGSIAAISRSFANAQIDLDALTSLFGEVNFGFLSRMVLGSLEGLMFGGFFMAGLEQFSDRAKKD